MKIINKYFYACLLAMTCFISHANNLSLANKPLSSNQAQLSRWQVKETIEQIIDVLNKEYLYPEKVDVLVSKLRALNHVKGSRYIKNKSQFIKEAGELLRRASGDGYFELIPSKRELIIGGELSYQNQQRKTNYGFEQARVLKHQIAYLKVNHLFHNKAAEVAAENALALLKESKAMIIDLREANEGSIEFAQYLMSYFFEEKTLLGQMYYQRQEKRHDLWSIEGVGHQKYKHNYPVYILTSAFVTSAAEFFSYTMKHFNKAVIVGEKTMGVARWSQEVLVNDWLMMKLPVALPVSPNTQSNWEGEGVIPDHQTDAMASFDLAYELAKLALN